MRGDPLRPAGTARLALRQVRAQVSLVLRSPTGAFFTLLVPLMVLVAMNLIYGRYSLPSRPDIRFPRFYTPAMAAFAVANACYVGLVTGITLSRDQGMLKRIRGTPLPPWVYLASRASAAAVVGVLSAVVVLIVGTTTYPVPFPWQAVPSLAASTAMGVVCFSALGLAASALVRSAEAALPFAYGTLLPACFVSDVFFPTDATAGWLKLAASTLPLRPLARSFESPFLAGGTGINWGDLAIMTAWTAVAVLVIVRYFKWETPAGEHHRGRVLSPRGSGRPKGGPPRQVGA